MPYNRICVWIVLACYISSHFHFRGFPSSRVKLVEGVAGNLRQPTDQFIFVLFLLDGFDLRLANLLVRDTVVWG